LIISIDAEKVFNKIQCFIDNKALIKLGIEEIYINIINTIFDKPIGKIILNGGKIETFFSKVRSKTRMSIHSTPIQCSHEIPSQNNKTGIRNKGIQIGKKKSNYPYSQIT
jgi:hypothetical protein